MLDDDRGMSRRQNSLANAIDKYITRMRNGRKERNSLLLGSFSATSTLPFGRATLARLAFLSVCVCGRRGGNTVASSAATRHCMSFSLGENRRRHWHSLMKRPSLPILSFFL